MSQSKKRKMVVGGEEGILRGGSFKILRCFIEDFFLMIAFKNFILRSGQKSVNKKYYHGGWTKIIYINNLFDTIVRNNDQNWLEDKGIHL